MARARTLKPGFFQNELLAECEPLARLLFQGLWLHCDREGRMEDRPRKIKVQILPFDDCDVDALLNTLAEKGFILRYEVDGVRYLHVVKFHKHQNPHHMEPPSELPPPPGVDDKFRHRPITKAQRERIFKRDGNKCTVCGSTRNLHIDHRVPISKGGTSDDDNLRLLCEKCNTTKGNKDDDSWAGRDRVDDDSSSSSGQVDQGALRTALTLNPITLTGKPIADSSRPSGPASKTSIELTRDTIWTTGVQMLVRAGVKEAQARPYLGKLVKEYGEDAVGAAIGVAALKNPVDPKAFIVATLQQRARKPRDRIEDLERAYEELEQQKAKKHG